MTDHGNSTTPTSDAGSCVEALLGLRGSPPAPRLPGVTALDAVAMATMVGSSAQLPTSSAPSKRARPERLFISPSPVHVDDRGVRHDQHVEELQSSHARYLPVHMHHTHSVPPASYSTSTSFASISEWTPPPRPTLPSLQTLTSGVYESLQSPQGPASWAMAPGYAAAQPPNQNYHPLPPPATPFIHQHPSLRPQHTENYSRGPAAVPQVQTILTPSHLRPPSSPFYFTSAAIPVGPILERHIPGAAVQPVHEPEQRHRSSEYMIEPPLHSLPRTQSSFLGSFTQVPTSCGHATAFPSVLHRPQSPRALPHPENLTERDTSGSFSNDPSNVRYQSDICGHEHIENPQQQDVDGSDEGYQSSGHENEQQLHGSVQPFHGNEQPLHESEQPYHEREQLYHEDEQPFHESEQSLHESEQPLRASAIVRERVPRSPTHLANSQSGLTAVAIVASSAAPLSPLVSRCDGEASRSESDGAISAPLAALAEVALHASPVLTSECARGVQKNVPSDAKRTEASPPSRLSPKTAERLAEGSSSEKYAQNGEVTRCPCGSVRNSAFMIACDGCNTWQHGKCMGIRRQGETPDVYFCHICRPDDVRPNCIAHPRYKNRFAGRDRERSKVFDPSLSSVKPLELRRMFSDDLKSREQSDEPVDTEELFNRYARLYRRQFGKDRQSIVEGLAIVGRMERTAAQEQLEEALKRVRSSSGNHANLHQGDAGISGDRVVESAVRCYPQNLTESPEIAISANVECAVPEVELHRDSRHQPDYGQGVIRFHNKGANDTTSDSDLRKRLPSKSTGASSIVGEETADQKNSSGRSGGKRSRRPVANANDLDGDNGIFGSDPEAASDVPSSGRQLSREERKLCQIVKMFKKLEEKEERGRRKPRAGATDSPKSAFGDEFCSRANEQRSDSRHAPDTSGADVKSSGTTGHAAGPERSSRTRKKTKEAAVLHDSGSSCGKDGRGQNPDESSAIHEIDAALATFDDIRELSNRQREHGTGGSPAEVTIGISDTEGIAMAQPGKDDAANGGGGCTNRNLLQSNRVVSHGSAVREAGQIDCSVRGNKGDNPVSLSREERSRVSAPPIGHFHGDIEAGPPILTGLGRGDGNECTSAVAVTAPDSGEVRPKVNDFRPQLTEDEESSPLKDFSPRRVAERSHLDAYRDRAVECGRFAPDVMRSKMDAVLLAKSERTIRPSANDDVALHKLSGNRSERDAARCLDPEHLGKTNREASHCSLKERLVTDSVDSGKYQFTTDSGDRLQEELFPKPEHTLEFAKHRYLVDNDSNLVDASVCSNERKPGRVADYKREGITHCISEHADDISGFGAELVQTDLDRFVEGTDGEQGKQASDAVHEMELEKKQLDPGRGRKRKRNRGLGQSQLHASNRKGMSRLQDQFGPQRRSVYEPPDGNVSDMEYVRAPGSTDIVLEEKATEKPRSQLEVCEEMSLAKRAKSRSPPCDLAKLLKAEAELDNGLGACRGSDRRCHASVTDNELERTLGSKVANGRRLDSGDALNRLEENDDQTERPFVLRDAVHLHDISKRGWANAQVREGDSGQIDVRLDEENGVSGAHLDLSTADSGLRSANSGRLETDVSPRHSRVRDSNRAPRAHGTWPYRDSNAPSNYISGESHAVCGSGDVTGAHVPYVERSNSDTDGDTEMAGQGHDGDQSKVRTPLVREPDGDSEILVDTRVTNTAASGSILAAIESPSGLEMRGYEIGLEHDENVKADGRGTDECVASKVQLLGLVVPIGSEPTFGTAVESRLSRGASSGEGIDDEEVRSWRERLVAVTPPVRPGVSDVQATDTTRIEVPIHVPGPSVLGSDLVPLSRRSSLEVAFQAESEANENKLQLPSKKLWLHARNEDLPIRSSCECLLLHFPAKKAWLKRSEVAEAGTSAMEEKMTCRTSGPDLVRDGEQVLKRVDPSRENVSVSMVVVSQRSTLPDHGRQLESSILLSNGAVRREDGVMAPESGSVAHVCDGCNNGAELSDIVRRVIVFSREGARADCLKKRPKLLLPESSLVTCADEQSQTIVCKSPRTTHSPEYMSHSAYPMPLIASSVPSPGGSGADADLTPKKSLRAGEEVVGPSLTDTSAIRKDPFLPGRSPPPRSDTPLLKKRCLDLDVDFSRNISKNSFPYAVSPSTPRLPNTSKTDIASTRDSSDEQDPSSSIERPSNSPIPLPATRAAEDRIPRRNGNAEVLLAVGDGGGQEILKIDGGSQCQSEERAYVASGTPRTNSSTSLSARARTQGVHDSGVSHTDAEHSAKSNGHTTPPRGVSSPTDVAGGVMNLGTASEIMSSPVVTSSGVNESGDTTARVPKLGSGQYSVRPSFAAMSHWRAAAQKYGNGVPLPIRTSPRGPGSKALGGDERSAGRARAHWNDHPHDTGPSSRRSFPPSSTYSSNGEVYTRNKESSIGAGESEFRNVFDHPIDDSKCKKSTFGQGLSSRTTRGDSGTQPATAAWSIYRQRNGWHRGSLSDPEGKRGGRRRGGFID